MGIPIFKKKSLLDMRAKLLQVNMISKRISDDIPPKMKILNSYPIIKNKPHSSLCAKMMAILVGTTLSFFFFNFRN